MKGLTNDFFLDNGQPISLTGGQAEIVASILNPAIKRIWIGTTTRYGKSLTVALSALLAKAFSGKVERIPIIAPSDEQSKIIMNYVLDHIGDDPVFGNGLFEKEKIERLGTESSKRRLKWSDGNEIYILSADASKNLSNVEKAGKSLMGFGGTIIIIDEAPLIPDVILAKVLRMLGDNPNSKLVLLGNPYTDNYFYTASQDPSFYKIHVPWQQAVEEGRLTREYVEEMRTSMDATQFKVLYDVEFVIGSDDSYIRNVDLEKGKTELAKNLSKESWIKRQGDMPIKVGVDVARSTSKGDNSVIYVRQGYKRLAMKKISTDDTMVLKGELVQLQKEFEFRWEDVVIDVVGVGAGLVDNMNELGYDVVGLNWGGKPDTEDMYYNMRTELWAIMKNAIVSGELEIEGGETIKDLVKPQSEYRYQRGGAKLLLESKESMRKRGHSSPDIADAIAYSFYERGFVFDSFGYLS